MYSLLNRGRHDDDGQHSMNDPWWRRAWSVLDRLLAELIWLHPASAAVFRSSAADEVAEDAGEDAVMDVVPARRAA